MIVFVGCSFQVEKTNPVLRMTSNLHNDDSYTLDLSNSLNFAEGSLQYQFTFSTDGQDAASSMNFKTAKTAIVAYRTIDLANNGTLYISGTYEKPLIYYVGPDPTTIQICATAKDSNATLSDSECINLVMETSPTFVPPNSTSTGPFSVSGTITGLNGTLVLQNNGGNNFTTHSNGSFLFTNTLADGETYNVTVFALPFTQTCLVTNGSGIISGSNVTNVNITCSSKAWTDPTDITDNISPDAGDVFTVQVAMDIHGNAIIAWEQMSGSNRSIFKSEYRNGIWTYPVDLNDHISPDGFVDAVTPQVAMDDNGNAIIVWQENDGLNEQIFKSDYRNGVWTHPVDLSDNISPDNQSATAPQVTMDHNGNAIIVWGENDGLYEQIFKSEYRSGSWTHPANLADNISPDGQDAVDSHVAIDDNGNAIIIWRQVDAGGVNQQTFKSEYRSGSWTHPANLADNISPDGQQVLFPKVAMDNNGNAIIVWAEQLAGFGSDYQIFKSEYRSGVWTNPGDLSDYISPIGQLATAPELAMDDNGNAIIVWEQYDGPGGPVQIFKSEYRTGVWTNPSDLSDNISPDGENAFLPFVTMDNNGNAIIAWTQLDGTVSQIFKAEYRNGAWMYPSDLTDNISPDGQICPLVQLNSSDNGNAIITWIQYDGTNYQLFTSEYR